MLPKVLKPLVAIILIALPCRTGAVDFPLTWRWSNPAPHGNNIIDMAYSQTLGLWVQVAERGQIHTSNDLEVWVPQESGTTESLRAVTFLGSRIVVTGENGTVLYADLEDDFLPAAIAPTTDWLEGVTSSNNRAVAVGDNGAIYTSNNGVNWEKQSTTFTDWLRGVTYGSAGFVAVGENGRIATSPEGISWTVRTSGTTAHLNRVSFSGGRYTVVGNEGVALNSSNGGVSWTTVVTGATNHLYTIAEANGTRLVAGEGEVRMQIGNNAWTDEFSAADPPAAWTYLSSLGQPGFFLLAGRTGIISEGYRTNTVTPFFWLDYDESYRDWQFDLFASDEFYVSVGDLATIFTSEEGIDWNLEPVPTSTTNEVFLGVGGDTNLLVTVGTSGTILISHNAFTNVTVTNIVGTNIVVTNENVSIFGVVWEVSNQSFTTENLQGVVSHQGLYVVTGGDGIILTSPDGLSWTSRSTPTTTFLSSVASFPGGLVACGDNGVILSSTDGVDWTAHTSGTTDWIYRVRYVGNTLIAVGQNGIVLTSTDGISWIHRNSNKTSWLNDVTFVDNTFFIVGSAGIVITSDDLVTWEDRGSVTLKSLFSVATDGRQLLSVGIEGIAIRSQIIPDLTPVTILEYSRLTSTNPIPNADNIYLFAGKPDQKFVLEYMDPTGTNGWLPGAELELLDSSGTLFYQETFVGTNLPPIEYYRTTLLP